MQHSHTTDEDGFNFMDNTGQEEHDRDMVGIILAVAQKSSRAKSI